jgi:hypothetical protein
MWHGSKSVYKCAEAASGPKIGILNSDFEHFCQTFNERK